VRRFAVWRGYDEKLVDPDAIKEVYAASLCCDANDAPWKGSTAPMVGVWSGRTSLESAAYVGYFILYSEELHAACQVDGKLDRSMLHDEFCEIVRAHQAKHGRLLPLPDEIVSPVRLR
jgi:hypothetical protein